MRVGRFLIPAMGCALVVCTLFAQRPFRTYPAWEYNNFPIPDDWNQPGEWVFARLMYPTTPVRLDWQSEYKRGYDWREGNTNWTIDYPRSDRHLSAAVRRLTRIHARSVEQPINLLEDDDVFNYPWLYAVEVGHWELTDAQIVKFREFLMRGGFFMCDDFHAANGRLMVAICHNMDLGDSWENADDPKYPERFSALGIRIGIDYIIYAMTH